MNNIIEKYKLEFSTIESLSGRKHVQIYCGSDVLLAYHLDGYFLGQDIGFLIEDVLPEINKSIAGQKFNNDGGGTLSFLTIQSGMCQFSSLDAAKDDVFIPTQDIRDIIMEWTRWIDANDLRRNIY